MFEVRVAQNNFTDGEYVEFVNKLVLNSGFVFDYTNMLGEGRIKTEDLQEMEPAMQKARDAVNEMRASGTAYKHLSKDGTPEPVYFTRLPEIKTEIPIRRYLCRN